MSFADSWYWASCALLLLALHFYMFSFYSPPFILSLSLAFSFSLSLFLSLSLYLCPLFLSVVARHMSSDALYQIFSSWSILLFHIISFHSSYKIHQLFTDYLLRLPSSELLEKHLFRSRANRRLVFGFLCWDLPTYMTAGVHVDLILTCFFSCKDRASERYRPHREKKRKSLANFSWKGAREIINLAWSHKPAAHQDSQV